MNAITSNAGVHICEGGLCVLVLLRLIHQNAIPVLSDARLE
jgi:hypothetical protein